MTPVSRGRTKREAEAQQVAATIVLPILSKSYISSSPEAPHTAPTRQDQLGSMNPRQRLSRILQQAQAFTKQSSDLNGSIAELVSQKELARCVRLIHDLHPPASSTSQAFSEVDIASAIESTPRAASSLREEAEASTASLGSRLNHPIIASPDQSYPEIAEAIDPPSNILASTAWPSAAGFMPSSHRATHFPGVRAYSSTSPLPMSTTLALAARQGSTTQKIPTRSAPSTATDPEFPRHPPRFVHPSQGPKLSELPLDQLKKNPRYRKTSRRYLGLIVGLPFVIMLSNILYKRCEFYPFPISVLYLAFALAPTGRYGIQVQAGIVSM